MRVILFPKYHYKCMDLNVFGVFQFITVIIIVDAELVPTLVSGQSFRLTYEFFLF